MAQLSNRETARLKTLLENEMDKIGERLAANEERLAANEKETASIRTDLNKVKSEVISILGLDEEQPPISTKRSVSNSISRNRKQGDLRS